MDSSAILPPIGFIGESDHSLATGYLSNLAREAADAAKDWHDRAERNLRIYTDGADPCPTSQEVLSNQIQDSVNAIVDFQTKDPAIRKLDPIERGEPGQVYYFTQPDASGQSQVAGPMTPQMAAQMQQQAAISVDPVSGQQTATPMFDPSGFVTIDDQSTAEFFQKQLDVYWNRGNLDEEVRESVHCGNVFGFFFPVYQWEKDTHRPRLWTDISLKNIYVDPTRKSIRNWAYAGVDWWMDAEEAKATWPHLAEIIEERARTGIPDRPGTETDLGFNVSRVGSFKRNTIIMRVFWLRNQPCPYEVNDALEAGLLERRMIPLGDPGATIENEEGQYPKGEQDDATDADNPVVQGHGEEAPPETGGAATGGFADSGPGAGTDEPEDSGDVQPSVQPEPATRSALFSASGSEVTGPTRPDGTIDPNWPMYRCTRQITAVMGLIVDDRECEYADIPLLQIIGTPIPGQPFGQGLPERLEAMQNARGQMLTAIKDHADLNAHPILVIGESGWNRLPEQYKQEGAKRSGMTIVYDDDFLKQGNVANQAFINPPPLSPALVQGEQIFHDELSERSGNPDVLQGKPPVGVTGWQSIQLLSQNASSRFGFSQQWTRDMITRLVRLVLHDITDPRKVTPRDLLAIDSRYPVPIVEAFQKRGAMIEWDVDVTVNTGVGGSKNRKQAEAIEAHQTLDPITKQPVLSTESLTNILGYDFEQEQQRNERAQQQAMQLQMAAAQQQQMLAPPQQGASQQGEPASNGQSDHPPHPGNGPGGGFSE